MASINYLWRNRTKPPVFSVSFLKIWSKRLLTFPELVRRNYRRKKLIYKGAEIHQTAEIGEVNISGALKLLKIGSESFLGRVSISIHAEIRIGNRVCINDNVEILTASHDVTNPNWSEIKSGIIIEDYAWIGTGAMILPGVTIGKGAVVGARAVVTKSLNAGEIVVGNPARALNHHRSAVLEYNPCEFLAANRSWLVG